MVISTYIERLFLYVTRLKYYLIVLGHPWLRRYDIDAKFGSNTLTISSPFYLKYYCPSPTVIHATTKEEEEFLSPKKFQRV